MVLYLCGSNYYNNLPKVNIVALIKREIKDFLQVYKPHNLGKV